MADTRLQGYLHGVVGVRGETVGRAVAAGSVGPVYVGTAPLNFATSPAEPNAPTVVRDMADAARLFGYSEDWASYTLCEAMYAHFMNTLRPIGPIVLINTLDPAVHRKAEPITRQLTLTNGVAVWTDETAILSSLSVDGAGEDVRYTVSHDPARGENVFTDRSGTLVSPVTVKYEQVDPALITEAEIIGTVDDYGNRTGIKAVELVYQRTSIVPATLAVPGWSHKVPVHTALLAIADVIDGHWFAGVATDILADATVATREQAIAWQAANGYSSELEIPCWPKGHKGARAYHLSTISCVAQQMTDRDNGDIPYETASNTVVDLDGYYVDGNIKLGFTQTDANMLNEHGIRTIAFWNGWRLWGAHTGAFSFENLEEVDLRAVFEPNLRMMHYVLNQFQIQFGERVDRPMSLADAQGIEAEANAWLGQLIGVGALITGEIHYAPNRENNDETVQLGKWMFSTLVAAPEPAQALVFSVAYDAEGARLARMEGGA